MKKVAVTFILLLAAVSICSGEKISSFEENFKTPSVLFVGDFHVYIMKPSLLKILIYDRKSFRKVGEFGSKGQGPSEFTGISDISFSDDCIYVSSYPKLCIFSKKGKLIKDIKGPPGCVSFRPMGNFFVGKSYPDNNPKNNIIKIKFSLFNPKLEKKKDFFLAELKKRSVYNGKKFVLTWFACTLDSVVYKDRLYIGDTQKGFHFVVYGSKGKKLYEINREYKKRKVTKEEKSELIENVRKQWGNRWNAYKQSYEDKFNYYYPAYKAFHVNDGRIYVFQYPKAGEYKILILDLKGNLLNQIVLPQRIVGDPSTGSLCICGGKFYKMQENEEEEVWELHEYNLIQ